MTPEIIGVFGIILLVVLILLRLSVGIALLLTGFIGIAWITDWNVAIAQLGMSAFTQAKNYSLSVIPLFVLMGMFLSYSGLGKDMFASVYKWFGNVRGGLAMATVGASAIFSAISGSSNATTATIARISIPEMDRYNYDRSLSTLAVAAGGTLGVLIPPSVLLIIYGAITNEPIGPLLIGGIIPGLIMTFIFMLMVNLKVRINPSAAEINRSSFDLKEKLKSLKTIWPFIFIFIISIGGIYFGIFTPSEAGGVGAFLALLVTLISKRLSLKKIAHSLDESLRISVMIFLILIGANLFGKFLALSRIPVYLSDAVANLNVSPYLILFLILIVYLILGMFLEGIAIMTLTLPIVYPMITSLGFDGLWFGIIMILIINIGVLTPPLGLSVYIISGIVKDMPIEKLFRAMVPAIIAMAILVVVLTAFPEIVTFLPEMVS